jgi:hypothetical protein
MSRDDRFIKQVESYLDEYEGVTPLPPNVRDAIRAALPATKQTKPIPGTTRYFTMSIPKPALYGLAAAAVIILVVLGAQLMGSNVGSPAPSDAEPTDGAAVASSTPAPSGDSCPTEPVTFPEPGVIAVHWCPPRDGNPVVAFTVNADQEWAEGHFGSSQMLVFQPAQGGAFALAFSGPETVDALVEEISSNEEFEVSEPQPVTLGGADGVVFEVTLAPGVDPDAAPPLFEDDMADWRVGADETLRVWVVDRPGEALAIVTRPPDQAWADAFEEILASLEWTN